MTLRRVSLSLITLLLVCFAGDIRAAGQAWGPADFEPLTSLPWKGADASIESVLETIFREPNIEVRYAVLAAYLRTLPVPQLSRAFDLCVVLEGTQSPDELVAFFLKIWAQRDPRKCWERTRSLFRLVFDDDWLNYDSWKERPRIVVQDAAAVRESGYRLDRSALQSFPLGVDRATLGKSERVLILKEFTDKWFRAFGTWPGYPRTSDRSRYNDPESDWELSSAFTMGVDQLRSLTAGAVSHKEIPFEIGLRRWLRAEPAAAPEVIKRAQETKWPPRFPGQVELRPAGPSTELFVIWAKADLPAMTRWADSLLLRPEDDMASRAKGFLMSRIDAATRKRWLAEEKAVSAGEDTTSWLMLGWAAWDPKAALEEALASGNPSLIWDVADGAASGPWSGPLNSIRFGHEVIRDFDILRIPETIRPEATSEWYALLELWGDIDIGETARYGVDFLLRTNYAPRARLIRFFSGHDEYPDEGGMIDRTFCALRTWAIVEPKKMKAWIGTLKEPEMRKALTWLLEHPWGTGAAE